MRKIAALVSISLLLGVLSYLGGLTGRHSIYPYDFYLVYLGNFGFLEFAIEFCLYRKWDSFPDPQCQHKPLY